MTDCSALPTQEEAERFKLDAGTINEVVTSPDNYTDPASDGLPKKTLAGLAADAAAAIQGVGFINKGEFSTLPTIENANEVAVFEGNFWLPTEQLPYTAIGSSPLEPPEADKWVVAVTAELLGIARSLNCLNSQVIYSADTTTVLDNVLYIYDAVAQTIWGKPAKVGAGETILSVVDDQLETNASSPSTYTLSGAITATTNNSAIEFSTVADLKSGVAIDGNTITFMQYQRVSVDMMMFKIALTSNGEYGIDLNDGLHTAVLDCGFITVEGWGADPTGLTLSDTAMDDALNFLRKRPPLAGDNFNLGFASRGVINLRGDAKYKRATPWLFEEDVITQDYATGITVIPNGATLVADASFTGVTRIKDDLSNTVIIKAMVIVGMKDYATQSGHFVSYVRISDLNVDGSGVLESALYEDVTSNNTFDGWCVNNCDYGASGKVVFKNNYRNWKLDFCNGTFNYNNTSLNDGYNSGLGLEGGGLNFGDVTITGDNGGAQPRLYMNKIGEFKLTSLISFQGLGDGIVIERNPSDSPTGSRWNQLGRVEIGDLQGKPLILSYASFIQCTDFIIVKDGLSVPLDASLMSVTGCGDVTLRGFDIDQFYDFDPDLSWGPVLDVLDSSRVKIEINNARAIPATNNAYDMIQFRGDSQNCEVIMGTLTQAVYSRLYKSPVSSEPTCKNIKVKGITTQAGAYVSSVPDLQGAGDSWDELTNELGKSPIAGLKSRVALTANQNLVQNYEVAVIRKSISNNVLTDLADINFSGVNLHNAIVDVNLIVTGNSGYTSMTERRKVIFNRTPASTALSLGVAIAAEKVTQSGSANYTVTSFLASEVASQFQLKIQSTVVFGGGIGDTAGEVTGTVTVSSKDGFDLVKL